MKYAFYLAGPFFNSVQIALIETLEKRFSDNCLRIYSPRQIDLNRKGPPNAEDAAAIFRANVDNIRDSRCMFAVLDWLMPNDRQLRIVETPDYSEDYGPRGRLLGEIRQSLHIYSPPLNLPDTGTVWEMGLAYAIPRPIVIYTERPPEAGLNLMLTQGTMGVVRGLDELDRFLNNGTIDWNIPQAWAGANR
jgi:nucleoside 2-deoxyribosyltransferase